MSLKKAIFYITLIFTMVLCFRLPTVSEKFFNVDEGIGAVVADSILEGGVYYRDSIDQRGPVTYYIYALIFALFGKNNMFAVHYALILLIFAIAVILYLTGVLIADRKVACWAVLFFGIFSHGYSSYDMLAFHTEWCAALFSAIGAYFFLKYLFKGRSIFIFFSGISFGLAFFSKQPALLDYLIALIFCFIFNCVISRKNMRPLIRHCFYMAAGFLFPVVMIVAYYLFNNALKDFWFYFYVYNVKYYAAAIPFWGRVKIASGYLINPKSFFMINSLLTVSFLVGGIKVVWQFVNNYRKPSRELLIDLYILFWGISAYIGASYTGRNFGHYYIMILPAFCILGGKAMQSRFNFLNYYLKSKGNKFFIIKIFLVILIFLSMVLPLIQRLISQKEVSISFSNKPLSVRLATSNSLFQISLWHDDALLIFQEKGIAKKIINLEKKELNNLLRYMMAGNNSASEKIFVWGFYPEIYVLANQRPASRYIYCNFLTGLLPWVNIDEKVDTSSAIVPGSWDIFMSEIKKNKPAYIIDTSLGNYMHYGKYPLYKFERFFNFILDNYAVDRVFFARDMRVTFVLFKRKDI